MLPSPVRRIDDAARPRTQRLPAKPGSALGYQLVRPKAGDEEGVASTSPRRNRWANPLRQHVRASQP